MKHKGVMAIRKRLRALSPDDCAEVPPKIKTALVDLARLMAAYEDLIEVEHICPKCGINWKAELNA
jgi:hypothetical protein